MGWLHLLRLVLSVANTVADIVRKRGLMDAGAQKELLLSTRAILVNAGIARSIEEETSKMTPEEILRELDGFGELRD